MRWPRRIGCTRSCGWSVGALRGMRRRSRCGAAIPARSPRPRRWLDPASIDEDPERCRLRIAIVGAAVDAFLHDPARLLHCVWPCGGMVTGPGFAFDAIDDLSGWYPAFRQRVWPVPLTRGVDAECDHRAGRDDDDEKCCGHWAIPLSGVVPLLECTRRRGLRGEYRNSPLRGLPTAAETRSSPRRRVLFHDPTVQCPKEGHSRGHIGAIFRPQGTYMAAVTLELRP